MNYVYVLSDEDREVLGVAIGEVGIRNIIESEFEGCEYTLEKVGSSFDCTVKTNIYRDDLIHVDRFEVK